jgi:hypothetical protein
MFVIADADAAVICVIFNEEGELSAAIELRPDNCRMEAAASSAMFGDAAASRLELVRGVP